VRLWGKAKVLHDTVSQIFSHLEPHAWISVALRLLLAHDQVAEKVRIYLDEQAFMTAWNEGRVMRLEQILDRDGEEIRA
jgi:hypothetical protein